MIIRKAKKTDADKIVKLLNSSKEIKAKPETKYDKEFVISFIKNDMNFINIASEKEDIAGVLMGEIWKDKKYAFITILLVNKDCRGKGVASMLLEDFENMKVIKKLKYANLLVQTENNNMQRWIEKRGYKKGYKFYYYEKKLRKK